MNSQTLGHYSHKDGLVKQHVTLTRHDSKYAIVWSNSLGNVLHSVEPYEDYTAATERYNRLRASCIADLLGVLSDE